ncbi:MAG: hypothetical protein FJ344_01900 [Sphingomonadales bacterium]|nr:hypothetical protein [Sphingomonadales bacterium]
MSILISLIFNRVKRHPVTRITFFVIGPYLLAFCSASHSFTKKGDKLAVAGMHEEAVQQYFMALGRDRTYIKARVGLQQSGQQTMQLSTDRFYRQHQDGNYRESIRTYRSMETLASDASALGIRLEMPGMLRGDYEQDLDRYLSQQYGEATRLNENRKFREAEQIFAEIKSWKTDYKDVAELSRLARIIPEYQDGRTAFDAGHYRKAYGHFEKVNALEPSYKETAELSRVSRARAQVRISLAPFENSQAFSIPMEIPRYVQIALGGLGNEFIEWTEPSSANPSDTSFVGTRLQLKGRIDELVYVTPQMQSQERRGYESYVVKEFNKERNRMENVTRYRKVVYTEMQGKSELRLRVSYQLVTQMNGMVLVSDVAEESVEDEVRYVTYGGNRQNLFAGTWRSLNEDHPGDRVLNAPFQKRDMERLLNASRQFRPSGEMAQEAQNTVAAQISSRIVAYEQSRLNP